MRHALAVAALVTLAACGSPSKPSPPDPPDTPKTPETPIDLTGTWSGTASDSSGPGTTTWVLTKTATGAAGTATTRSPLGTVVLTGTVSLEQTGTSATWRLDIPAGGVSELPACTVTVTGTATIAATTITGTYNGTGSCSAPFTDGTVSLTKQ